MCQSFQTIQAVSGKRSESLSNTFNGKISSKILCFVRSGMKTNHRNESCKILEGLKHGGRRTTNY